MEVQYLSIEAQYLKGPGKCKEQYWPKSDATITTKTDS